MDSRVMENTLDEKDLNKDVIITKLMEDFEIKEELAEAMVWDWLCTEEGWSNLKADIQSQLQE